jgi:nucleoid-associated protein YgaU
MTRETKIGLLVGLAFIIVIGILLSDHMATTTEPLQAALNTAADTARAATVVPNESRGGAVLPNNTAVRDITPPARVPTSAELTQQRPIGDISVGGPVSTGATASNNTSTNTGTNNAVALQDTGTQIPSNNVPPGPSGVDPRLLELARQHGEELTNAGSRQPTGNTGTTGNNTTPPHDNRTTTASTKTYTVETGDTLGKIASKTLGSNTKANRDAIVKANPQIADPNKVVIGQVYNIPTASIVPPSTPSGMQTGTRVLPLTPPTTARDTRSTTTTATSDSSISYTVKAGDNLYRIATDHVGNPQAVAAIKELNKDVLKGGDGIRVGMRLKLPAKPVASAN